MAHHVGMSLLACANAMFDDIFVRRFMRDDDMKRAAELLAEKPPVNGAVYAGIQERVVPEVPGRTASMTERFGHRHGCRRLLLPRPGHDLVQC